MRQLTHFITLVIEEYGTPGKSATKCGEEYQISFFHFTLLDRFAQRNWN